MLDNPRYAIKGLTLLNETIIHDQAVADDTILYLERSNRNLGQAKEVLHHFSPTSRTKVNMHKSVVIWASPLEKQTT